MFGLSEHTLALLKEYFLTKKDIQQVRIYGSRATGTEEKGSDIDLVIFTSANRDLSGHIMAELEDLPTPYIFDVIDYAYLKNPSLKDRIDSMSKLLFECAELEGMPTKEKLEQ